MVAHSYVMQHPEFDAVLAEIVAKAKAAMDTPECHARIEKAAGLLQAGLVRPDSDGKHFLVQSQKQDGTYYRVNGECECEDVKYGAPGGICKHRLAVGILRRVAAALPPQCVVAPAAAPSAAPEESVDALDPAYALTKDDIVMVHGKAHVTYKALLAMAHVKGLKKLSARFISVTKDLALAEATAEFDDGSVYQESSDATPENVGFQVKPHFARMALTRAKSRALRDALNIGTCALEELGE